MQKKWIRQKTEDDNGAAAIANLFYYMGIHATISTIRESVYTHPDFPSLNSVAEAMEGFGVQIEAVEGDIDHLHEIHYPNIAHLSSNQLVMLHKLDDKKIFYLDPRKGWMIKTLDEFGKLWSGVILLATKTKKSGEKRYTENRRKERLSALRIPLAITVAVFMLVYSISFHIQTQFAIHQWLFLLSAKTMGLALCSILLGYRFLQDSAFLKRLCTTNSTIDCKSVLMSPAAKLFKWMPMADIGFLYFAGGLLTLILVPMYNETLSVLSILMHLNLFTLPYTLFSIYYQIFKLKKLCWLCLCVQGVLWLEFAITFSFLERNINPLTYTSLQPLVFGFLLPTFVWILIKQPLILASQTSKWRYESLRFRNNPLVFGALLQQAPKVDIGRLPVEIEIGVPHAPHCLTIVVNPKCKPCSHAHREFEELLEDFPEHIRGNFRFLYWKENDEDKRVVQHIIALALSGQQNLSYEALSKWFSYSETKDIEIWKNLFSLNNEVTVSVVEEIIECHLQWAKNVGVSGTPSFFLNGYPLPEGFKLRDLRAYLLVSNN